jgi:HAD superfamily hydrolase (TIGR01509 family)
MSGNEIETLIFDMDGTIVDTEKTAAEAVERTLTQWGITVSKEDASFVVGRKFEVAIHYLRSKYHFPLGEEETHQEILVTYRRALKENMAVVPGVVESIRELSKHYTMALVSGSGRAEILWILKQLDIEAYFKVILGAEDYQESKPSPEGYLKAMTMLAVEPHKVIVFEDSKPGIHSGRDAGAWVVAIQAANYYKQDQSYAHLQIHDFLKVDDKWIKSLKF